MTISSGTDLSDPAQAPCIPFAPHVALPCFGSDHRIACPQPDLNAFEMPSGWPSGGSRSASFRFFPGRADASGVGRSGGAIETDFDFCLFPEPCAAARFSLSDEKDAAGDGDIESTSARPLASFVYLEAGVDVSKLSSSIVRL